LNDTRNNRDKLLSEIFEKWPILNHPMDWLLIVQDFEHLELSIVARARPAVTRAHTHTLAQGSRE